MKDRLLEQWWDEVMREQEEKYDYEGAEVE